MSNKQCIEEAKKMRDSWDNPYYVGIKIINELIERLEKLPEDDTLITK